MTLNPNHMNFKERIAQIEALEQLDQVNHVDDFDSSSSSIGSGPLFWLAMKELNRMERLRGTPGWKAAPTKPVVRSAKVNTQLAVGVVSGVSSTRSCQSFRVPTSSVCKVETPAVFAPSRVTSNRSSIRSSICASKLNTQEVAGIVSNGNSTRSCQSFMASVNSTCKVETPKEFAAQGETRISSSTYSSIRSTKTNNQIVAGIGSGVNSTRSCQSFVVCTNSIRNVKTPEVSAPSHEASIRSSKVNAQQSFSIESGVCSTRSCQSFTVSANSIRMLERLMERSMESPAAFAAQLESSIRSSTVNSQRGSTSRSRVSSIRSCKSRIGPTKTINTRYHFVKAGPFQESKSTQTVQEFDSDYEFVDESGKLPVLRLRCFLFTETDISTLQTMLDQRRNNSVAKKTKPEVTRFLAEMDIDFGGDAEEEEDFCNAFEEWPKNSVCFRMKTSKKTRMFRKAASVWNHLRRGTVRVTENVRTMVRGVLEMSVDYLDRFETWSSSKSRKWWNSFKPSAKRV